MNKNKEKKILKLLNDYISDMELKDIDIVVTGYREYDIDSFKTNLDPKNIYILEKVDK